MNIWGSQIASSPHMAHRGKSPLSINLSLVLNVMGRLRYFSAGVDARICVLTALVAPWTMDVLASGTSV
jgi:hypothetical protein